jgi:hypothetical protein
MGLFGFINVRHPRRWIGTKIHVKRGKLGGEIGVSQEVFNYLLERANLERSEAAKISPKQKEIIALAYRNNPDRAVASETWQAMGHDVRLFGFRHFRHTAQLYRGGLSCWISSAATLRLAVAIAISALFSVR